MKLRKRNLYVRFDKFSDISGDCKADYFIESFKDIVNKLAPKRQSKRNKYRHCPWFNGDILENTRQAKIS